MSKIKRIFLVTIVISLAIGGLFFIVRQAKEVHLGTKFQDYYVSKVIDGDTIQLSNNEKVRYIGIDTPEIRKRKGPGWVYEPMPYGLEAKDFNKRLVEGKRVRLEFDVQKRDKYNRLLAYVYVDGKMVNLEMVREGYAMIYTYPPNVKYADMFLEAQREARTKKKGLWAELDKGVISSSEARKYIGHMKIVETKVYNTFISNKLLILNCRDNFKVVVFRKDFSILPKEAIRSPDTYFRHKDIRVYGVIKEYKNSPEIILHNQFQLEILD